jgi:hypothetical protein
MTERARPLRAGDVYAFELAGGRFGSSQVIAQNGEGIELVSLGAIWETYRLSPRRAGHIRCIASA